MSVLARQRHAETVGVIERQPPTLHSATLGWRRTFLSATDAQQYDRGYALWPAPMPDDAALSTPFSSGWFDAEHDAQEREESRQDAALARRGIYE